MTFTAAQIDLLEANEDTVEQIICLELQFVSGTVRLSTAPRDITLDGHSWLGTGYVDPQSGARGSIVEMGDITRSEGFLASDTTYRVTARLNDLKTVILGSEAEYRDRLAIRSLQLYAAGVEVGPRVVLHTGRMVHARGYIDAGTEYAELQVGSRFRNRNRVANGRYAHTDQQARSPGDLGFEFVHTFTRKRQMVGWLRA